MKLVRIIYIILPTSIAWVITALFLLVYAFDILESVFPIEKDFLFNPGFILLFLTASIATISLYITGYLIDRDPINLNTYTTISLISSGISLLLIVLGVDIEFFLIIGFLSLGISLGILASCSGALYGGFTEVDKRGQIYAVAIILSAFVSLVTILLFGMLQFEPRYHLLFIGCLSIIVGFIFYPISKSVDPWVNDPFPTPLKRIILERRSVKVYLIAHFFIYLMIGVAFTTISSLGNERNDLIINLLVKFTIEQTTFFWLLVFLGDLFFVFPMGILSDNVGRKNLMVVGSYAIVCAALIVGLSTESYAYYFSAFLLGAGFAAMHPTIDSAVWADLSPLDSLGRYYALGFIFLLQGIGVGLAFGLFILPVFLPFTDPSTLSYILIGLAILGLFPLFFVADTYRPLDIFLLLLSKSGMLIFSHDFQRGKEISNKDLSLVTGALSAISTIFDETIHDEEAALDLVRHGNVFIVQAKVRTQKGDLIGTIFANKNDPELHRSLESFVSRFILTYHEELQEWVGQTSVFNKAAELAENVFGPLIPSKTL